MRTTHVAFACSLLSALGLADVLVPVAQERYVSGLVNITEVATGTVTSDSASIGAPDFGPFAEMTTVQVTVGGSSATAFAQQASSISDTIIAGEGTSFGGQTVDAFHQVESLGDSRLTVTFELPNTSNYRLLGQIIAGGCGMACYSLRETNGPFVFTDFVLGIVAPTQLDINHEGKLPAATYTLEFRAFAGDFVPPGGQDGADAEFEFELELSQLPMTYCSTAPNSAGPGAVMGTAGPFSVSQNDLALEVSRASVDQFGVFYYGPDETRVPFGDGFRCIDGAVLRLQPPLLTDSLGAATRALDFTDLPAGGAIQVDSRWNFQFWYRDPLGPGGTGFNLSDAISITFCP